MSCYLLDTNILIPLLWPNHTSQVKVLKWFRANAESSFATCSLTQAGFLRITTTPAAMKVVYKLHEAKQLLFECTKRPGHKFLQTNISIFEAMAPFEKRMQGAKQITDAYLLGIARHHGAKLATFDKAIKSLAGPEHAHFVELLS